VARPIHTPDPFERGEKAKPHGKADARHPVAENRNPHRHARVLKPAQGSGSNGLHPVGELENRCQQQVLQREADQRGIGHVSRINIDCLSSSSGASTIALAVIAMKPVPIARATQPARRMPSGSRAP
jgi:hypothetical protein